jgi:hypothetical protein
MSENVDQNHQDIDVYNGLLALADPPEILLD